jgi:hypothetical protein
MSCKCDEGAHAAWPASDHKIIVSFLGQVPAQKCPRSLGRICGVRVQGRCLFAFWFELPRSEQTLMMVASSQRAHIAQFAYCGRVATRQPTYPPSPASGGAVEKLAQGKWTLGTDIGDNGALLIRDLESFCTRAVVSGCRPQEPSEGRRTWDVRERVHPGPG